MACKAAACSAGFEPQSSRGKLSPRGRKPTLQTAQSRALLEGYWRSVLNSGREPPLYHTFSDRYGGTQGIPYASRTPAGRAFTLAASRAHGECGVADCIAAADCAMLADDLAVAERRLKEALTHLQNHDGGLSLAALATTTSHATAAELLRTRQTAEVLLRLGKIALLRSAHAEALRLLTLSGEANPLVLDVYALRAACHERMGEPRAAYTEYAKYLRLCEPSMEVLAHCGKCAAEAALFDEAEHHLHALLQSACAEVVEGGEDAETAFARAFYAAHADFYLGYLYQQQAKRLIAGDTATPTLDPCALRERAAAHLSRAAENTAFVQLHEAAVEEAVGARELGLARRLLQHLQRLRPGFAGYHLRTAEVCKMAGDVDGELLALSDALDGHQSVTARRRTLLVRGVVYAEVVHELDRAIRDYALVLDTGSNAAVGDRCGAVAHFKRAEAYRRRHTRGGPTRREDEAAARRDYDAFLRATDTSSTTAEAEMAAACDAGVRHRAEECYACLYDVHKTIEALLLLAHGAYEQREYGDATRFFARAIARGWSPTATSVSLALPFAEGLVDEMYIALAQHVMQGQPISEDMFRVPYEHREWLSLPDARRARALDRRETERVGVASPCLGYVIVDARYCALRALEPSMFTRLEDTFLELWEVYRGEVERSREDAAGVRGGRRPKRYVQS